jgi:hypothetical protein
VELRVRTSFVAPINARKVKKGGQIIESRFTAVYTWQATKRAYQRDLEMGTYIDSIPQENLEQGEMLQRRPGF